MLAFSVVNAGYHSFVSASTGQDAATNSIGWGVYVGANYETTGSWNPSDSIYMGQLFESEASLTANFDELFAQGIARYQALSPVQLADLVVSKSLVLGGDLQHATYNMVSYPVVWQSKMVQLLTYLACAVWSLLVLILALRFCFYSYHSSAKPRGDFYIFALLAFGGLFTASLVVEVANRYFMPLFGLLIILACSDVSSARRAHKVKSTH